MGAGSDQRCRDAHWFRSVAGTGKRFEASSPNPLFLTHPRQPISAMDFFTYDVTADGQKFLVDEKVDTSNTAPLSVVLNWSSEMEK